MRRAIEVLGGWRRCGLWRRRRSRSRIVRWRCLSFVRVYFGDFGFREGGIPSSELDGRDFFDIGELFPSLFLFMPLIGIGAASATSAAILTIPHSTKMVGFDISSTVHQIKVVR